MTNLLDAKQRLSSYDNSSGSYHKLFLILKMNCLKTKDFGHFNPKAKIRTSYETLILG
jgi:hypothetical protein